MWLACGALTRELRDGEVVVGSGADADWRVPTADLMPRHFTIVVHGLNASLRPSSKDTVVVVNGRQLTGAPHLLNDGDVVLAGSGRFIFADDAPRIEPVSPRTDAAYLVDEGAQVVYPLLSRSTTIGRDRTNAVVVRDPGASRFHAEIRREAGGFVLHSMGSAGSFVNSQRISTPSLMQNGDRITIAYANFRFTSAAPDGLPVASAHDMARSATRRNPTLATGKLSVVPRRRGPGPLVLGTLAVLAVAAIIALYLSR